MSKLILKSCGYSWANSVTPPISISGSPIIMILVTGSRFSMLILGAESVAIKRTTWAGRRPRSAKSKKDTRRWCKGVVGRKHNIVFHWSCTRAPSLTLSESIKSVVFAENNYESRGEHYEIWNLSFGDNSWSHYRIWTHVVLF